ncbi:cell division protein ZapE [uncultured Rheinheimera sp.]|uniref:cell division protein ZapE n=1 Tax=uncultured Rheinheimera sp. TaxID=400532 RepID=UPI0025988742|nr:cell division protein ZapE [uncultured Rheinheimera sp.]
MSSNSLTSLYQQQVQQGLLLYDEPQYQSVLALQQIADQLCSGLPTLGLYIHGPVGRGKTMLMDLFYQQLALDGKIRLHFHHFMARVHQELKQHQGEADPLLLIAKDWAFKYKVLCFDEFFVNDIGDAMLLGTLWRYLFQCGVVLVTTSNAVPEELYKNGLQRQRFLPTIDLLRQHCKVVTLDNGIDYRRLTQSPMRFYQQGGTAAELKQQAQELFGKVQPLADFELLGRSFAALWSNDQVIGFDFMALCSGPRSQLDYMQLASRYRAIAVLDVPQFSAVSDTAILHGVEDSYQREHQDIFISKLDNEARRFIALVDECYDRGCLLLLSSAVAIAELYQAKQLEFAFARCESRLYEMQQWQVAAAKLSQTAATRLS